MYACMHACVYAHLSIYRPTDHSLYLSISLSLYNIGAGGRAASGTSIYLSTDRSLTLFIYPSIHLQHRCRWTGCGWQWPALPAEAFPTPPAPPRGAAGFASATGCRYMSVNLRRSVCVKLTQSYQVCCVCVCVCVCARARVCVHIYLYLIYICR